METNSTGEDNASTDDHLSADFAAPTPQQPKKQSMLMDPPVAPRGTVAMPLDTPSPDLTSASREPKPEGGAEHKEDYLPPPPPKVESSRQSNPAAGGFYKPPSWGVVEAPEASGLSLTVLKAGVEVNNISLDNQTHVLLGESSLLEPDFLAWSCSGVLCTSW